MNITILSIDIKTVPTAKGSYQTAEVAYKNNTFQGKVEGKKVMSFGATQKTFATLATAASGDTFEVEVVKNDKGYNDWVSLTKAGATTGNVATAAPAGKATAAPKSNYETPEERAQRQVYIIRQSSLSSAAAVLTAGAKTPPAPDSVIALAQQFVDYVMGNDKKAGGATGFDDLPDFEIPTVE